MGRLASCLAPNVNPIVSMKRQTVLLGLALLGIAAIATIAFNAWRRPALTVSFASATRGSISRQVLTSGVLEPKSAVDTGSQVSGTIQSLSADFNSRVKAGQIIAQIDPSVYDTRLTEARAERIKAEAEAAFVAAELADVQTKAARAVELASAGLVTQAELDGAQFAVRQAEAALKSARAAAQVAKAGVDEATVNRSRTIIRSPMDGLVVSRNVEVGQTIAASLASPVLFRIADLSTMLLLADVGEAEAGEVRPGDQVTFEVESIGVRTFTGTVSEVRLGSKLEQAGQSGQPAATGASGTPATTGTSGATGTSGTSPATAATTSPATTSTTATATTTSQRCRRTSGRGSLLHGGHQRR